MRIVFLILFACVLTTPETTLAQQASKNKSSTNTQSTQKWIPTGFAMEGRLPKTYRGVGTREFYKMFTERAAKVVKDEFETTEAFHARVRDVSKYLSPISPTENYSFMVEGIDYKYNPEMQRYEARGVSSGARYSCILSKGINLSYDGYDVCEIADISSQESTYTGETAFGRKSLVKKSSSVEAALALRKDDAFYERIFHSRESHRGFDLDIVMGPEAARALKGNKIRVLLIGNVIAAEIPKYTTYVSPTVDLPYDIYSEKRAIPFRLNKVVVYVYETGEVLAEQSRTEETLNDVLIDRRGLLIRNAVNKMASKLYKEYFKGVTPKIGKVRIYLSVQSSGYIEESSLIESSLGEQDFEKKLMWDIRFLRVDNIQYVPDWRGDFEVELKP